MNSASLDSTADELLKSHELYKPEHRRAVRSLEWPTLTVAACCYGIFILITGYYQALPLLLSAPLMALCLTWYGSLQHETIHHHPTSSRRANRLIAALPLTLYLPYRLYRLTHLQHHRHQGRYLTDPSKDPESFYAHRSHYQRFGGAGRWLCRAEATFAGRLALGPWLGVMRFWRSELSRVLSGDRTRVLLWLKHLLAVTSVLLWLRFCHVPFLIYALLMVYPSLSLTMLRSFAEHRAARRVSHRTVTVESHPLWQLLFLNNNLHLAHHVHPKLPWYQLPARWAEMRADALRHGLIVHGYLRIVAQYGLNPVIHSPHPGDAEQYDENPHA
jgi:fatty acid desaturase